MKGAACTDIHFGKKANSKTHNEDCLRFLSWFCEQVRKDPEIDHILFLGDWNENRSSLNIETLKYSYLGAKMLNSLGMPVFFVVGNHDLYHRHNRDVHSVIPFNEFENFHVIDEPTIVEQIGNGGAFVCPFMFPEEYPALSKFTSYETWWGHFEFKGFMVTGYGMVMQTGPDIIDFRGPKYIVSGHFHKRQAHENVVYMGNTFPMDFGDAGDTHRGMMVYDHNADDEIIFYDWDDCPKYTKTTLSELIDNTVTLYPESRVKCIVDIPISFEESTALRQKFTEMYQLREFTLEESVEIKEAMTDTEVDIGEDGHLLGVNELVIQMLDGIETDHIDSEILKDVYQTL